MHAPVPYSPFRTISRNVLIVISMIVLAVMLGIGVAKGGMPVAILLIAGPLGAFFVVWCVLQPKVALWTCFYLGFFVAGFNRIAPSVPLGLAFDGLLGLSLIGLLVTKDPKTAPENTARLKNIFFYLLLVWLVYTILELLNPIAQSRQAWFYGVRSLSFIWVEVTLIALLRMNRLRDLNQMVNIWLGCGIVSAFWAFKQQYLGLSGFDQVWLDTWGRQTHLLFGHLRSFSFCSDAGQYGAVMAHCTLYTIIRTVDEPTWRGKSWYLLLTAIFFWGYAIAGSRGPLFILAAGFVMYLVLKRNVVLLTAGMLVIGSMYGLLKYTSAGQSNYQIQRMRTALDPNDRSFQMRLENQRAFAVYMSSRPIGNGIGTAGERGKQFNLQSELTQRGIDSWYVKIWVETGVVGLVMHVFTLILFGVIAFRKVYKLQHPRVRSVMIGLLSGYVGVCCASYGNMIFGQYPTNLTIYMTMAFLLMSDSFDREAMAAEAAKSATPLTN